MRTTHLQWLNMSETEKNWNDSLRAAGEREVLSVKTCIVCTIFFVPSLLGRQGCSWWILKQIWLIIVFHNCHAERDCPLRSYLCHCISLPLSLSLSLSLCSLFNKTQITTEIVKSTSKIIKSKWRIYGWHFITINLRCLINKVRSSPSPLSRSLFLSFSSVFTLPITKVVLFEWDGGGGEQTYGWQDGCQGWHECHSFWLMEHFDPAPNPPSFPACPHLYDAPPPSIITGKNRCGPSYALHFNSSETWFDRKKDRKKGRK